MHEELKAEAEHLKKKVTMDLHKKWFISKEQFKDKHIVYVDNT